MNDAIGQKVRAWRLACKPKITQAKLAKLVCISQSSLNRFETGKGYVSDETGLNFERVTRGKLKMLECVSPKRRETLLRLSGALRGAKKRGSVEA